MAYDPGPEGWCPECRRLVPLQPAPVKVPRQRRAVAPPVLVDHRTYRVESPFTREPGYCQGSGETPAAPPRGADTPHALP